MRAVRLLVLIFWSLNVARAAISYHPAMPACEWSDWKCRASKNPASTYLECILYRTKNCSNGYTDIKEHNDMDQSFRGIICKDMFAILSCRSTPRYQYAQSYSTALWCPWLPWQPWRYLCKDSVLQNYPTVESELSSFNSTGQDLWLWFTTRKRECACPGPVRWRQRDSLCTGSSRQAAYTTSAADLNDDSNNGDVAISKTCNFCLWASWSACSSCNDGALSTRHRVCRCSSRRSDGCEGSSTEARSCPICFSPKDREPEGVFRPFSYPGLLVMVLVLIAVLLLLCALCRSGRKVDRRQPGVSAPVPHTDQARRPERQYPEPLLQPSAPSQEPPPPVALQARAPYSGAQPPPSYEEAIRLVASSRL